MKVFLIRGENRRGKAVVERISAPTAREAMAQLQERGFSKLELLTDDITFAPDKKVQRRISRRLSAADQARFMRSGPLETFWLRFKLICRESSLALVGAGALLATRLAQGQPLDAGDFVFLVGMLLVAVVFAALPPGGGIVKQMYGAHADADWRRMLRLVPKFRRKVGRVSRVEAEVEGARLKALALAGLGESAEALRTVQLLEECNGVGRARSLCVLADVQVELRDYQGALRSLRQATEVEPKNVQAWLQLAELLALRLERSEEARHALDHVIEAGVSESMWVGVRYVEGAVALAARRDRDACEHLDACLAECERRMRREPVLRGVRAMAMAMSAISRGRLGKLDEARAHLAEAEPFLVAHREQALLRRARDVVGGGQSVTHAGSAPSGS